MHACRRSNMSRVLPTWNIKIHFNILDIKGFFFPQRGPDTLLLFLKKNIYICV